MLTNCAAIPSARTDPTGYHLARIECRPQRQPDAIAAVDLGGQPLGLLNAQRRQTCSKARSSNAAGAPNGALIPRPVNLSTVPP
jgi:hypothetical protein